MKFSAVKGQLAVGGSYHFVHVGRHSDSVIYIYLSVTDIRSDSVLPRKAHTRAANETQLTPAAHISYAVYSSTGTRGRFSEQLRIQSSRKHCRRKPALREVRQNPRCTTLLRVYYSSIFNPKAFTVSRSGLPPAKSGTGGDD